MIRAIVSLLSLFSVFCSLLLFTSAFLVSCDEVSEVEVEQVERVLSANCDQLKIHKAYHHLDYGVVWIELDENPPRSFWDDLKASGWKWQESPEPAFYLGNEWFLSYDADDKTLVFKPARYLEARGAQQKEE